MSAWDLILYCTDTVDQILARTNDAGQFDELETVWMLSAYVLRPTWDAHSLTLVPVPPGTPSRPRTTWTRRSRACRSTPRRRSSTGSSSSRRSSAVSSSPGTHLPEFVSWLDLMVGQCVERAGTRARSSRRSPARSVSSPTRRSRATRAPRASGSRSSVRAPLLSPSSPLPSPLPFLSPRTSGRSLTAG